MTLPTPETLARHELAGLRVRIVEAPNPDLVGIEGRVVRETAKTLVVDVAPEAGRARGEAPDSGAPRGPERKQVPKEGTTFEFALGDEAAATREGAGTASERPSETAGAGASTVDGSGAGGSGGIPERRSGARRAPQEPDGGEGVAYVTVDGARLLSRPARRTETGGRPTWR